MKFAFFFTLVVGSLNIREQIKTWAFISTLIQKVQ